MQMRSGRGVVVALTALLIAAVPLATQAQSPAPMSGSAMSSMADVSCDKAAPMMMGTMQSGAMSPAAMPASGDVDKAYAMMMTSHAKMMMDMAKLEMRCGKDKKTKDAAAQNAPDLQKLIQTLTVF